MTFTWDPARPPADAIRQTNSHDCEAEAALGPKRSGPAFGRAAQGHKTKPCLGDLQKPTILAPAAHGQSNSAKAKKHHRPGAWLGNGLNARELD